jgi:hypothetical protein
MVPLKSEKEKSRYPYDANGALEIRKREIQVPIECKWCPGNPKKRNPGTHRMQMVPWKSEKEKSRYPYDANGTL